MAFASVRGNEQIKARRGGNGGGGKFAPVKPGRYLAIVESVEVGHYEAGFKGAKGKFSYLKVTPEYRLLNEAGTVINRQDVTFGVQDNDGVLYRPVDDGKPALFGEAQFFLSALGFVDADDNIALEKFHPALVCGQVVAVRVDNKPYESNTGEERLKNVITGVFAVDEKDVEEHGLFRDSIAGMAFLHEDAVAKFEELFDAFERGEFDEADPF